MLTERMTNRWWTLILRGLFAIAFGVLTIMVPLAAVGAFVLLFAVYSLADGIWSLAALTRANSRERWLQVLSGILGIAAGLIALFWPGITALALFMVIAIWAVLLGAIELSTALSRVGEIEGDWVFVLGGVLWIAFGVALLVWPGPGVIAVLSMIAAFAIVRGVMLIVAGARVKALQHRLTTSRAERAL